MGESNSMRMVEGQHVLMTDNESIAMVVVAFEEGCLLTLMMIAAVYGEPLWAVLAFSLCVLIVWAGFPRWEADPEHK